MASNEKPLTDSLNDLVDNLSANLVVDKVLALDVIFKVYKIDLNANKSLIENLNFYFFHLQSVGSRIYKKISESFQRDPDRHLCNMH